MKQVGAITAEEAAHCRRLHGAARWQEPAREPSSEGVAALATVEGLLAPSVHDMRRTRDAVSLDDWLAALQAELRALASSSAEGRIALERLLDS